MKNSILVAWNDSMSSRAALDFIIELPLHQENSQITLLHVFRKASASEELMGKTFTEKEAKRLSDLLRNAEENLAAKGFNQNNIHIVMEKKHYPTIADGIIDQYNKGDYDVVVIGRKRMSKAEEFVMGDISVKLVRALKNAAILIVKPPY